MEVMCLKCSLCHRYTTQLKPSWLYCHGCNIQIRINQQRFSVYDIHEDGELHLNHRKSYVFKQNNNLKKTRVV
jgi:hypothetical protein